jgi:hypothetical protein
MEKSFLSRMKKEGKLIKNYKKGEVYYAITFIEKKNWIAKYRCYKIPEEVNSTYSGPVYYIDLTNKKCFTYKNKADGSIMVADLDCENVKKDPDVAEYITW